MTLATYADLCIRPYLESEITPRAPIVDDGPAGYTGTDSWVKNQATLWAQSGHYVINEKFFASEDINTDWASATEIYYGSWAFQIPKWMNSVTATGRRYLYFFLQTDPGVAPDFTYRIRSADGLTLLATGVRTSVDGQWVVLFDIPLPASTAFSFAAEWFEFLLSVEWDGTGTGTFDVTGACGMVKRVTTADANSNNSGIVDLVDPDQLADGQPLDVYCARALTASNEAFFASNVRPVVTSGWYAGGSDDLLDATPIGEPGILLGDSSALSPRDNPYWEWIYFPRQGVTRLRVGINAVKVTADRTLLLGFQGHRYTELDVTTTTTGPAHGNWQKRGDLFLEIPPLSGPLKFRVLLKPSSSTTDAVRICQLMIHEDVLKGTNLE